MNPSSWTKYVVVSSPSTLDPVAGMSGSAWLGTTPAGITLCPPGAVADGDDVALVLYETHQTPLLI
jgi:hypothetical protein